MKKISIIFLCLFLIGCIDAYVDLPHCMHKQMDCIENRAYICNQDEEWVIYDDCYDYDPMMFCVKEYGEAFCTEEF